MVKRDWMYESDDDEGEDLGSNAGDDDYDEVLGGGEDGQKKEEETGEETKSGAVGEQED